MKIFILEDDPERIRWFREEFRQHETTFVTSCVGVDHFEPPYDIIFLDHDLGGRALEDHEDCGTTFVQRILPKLPPHSQVVIHSYNKDGAARMSRLLTDAGIEHSWAPFRGPTFASILDTMDWFANVESRNPNASTT
jgi:hypothetical protein